MSREQRDADGDGALAIPHIPALGQRVAAKLQTCDQVATLFYYYAALATIGLISVYDAYLVRVYRSFILDVERNPVCVMLIRWDPNELSYFVVAKATGTIAVLVALAVLLAWRRRIALLVVTGVTMFQLALLGYLNSGT